MLSHRRHRAAALAFASLAFAGLAGTARSAAVCHYVPALDVRAEPARVAADPRLLDAAAGTYGVADYDLENVMTVSREGDHLVARQVGRPDVALEPIGPSLFAYGADDDRIQAKVDRKGQVTGLTWLRNHMRDLPMPRIGADQAAKLEARFERRLDAASGAPRSEPALRSLVNGLQTGKPDYDAMGIELNIATHKQLTRLRPFLNDLGPVQSVTFLGFMAEGLNGVDGETYDVVHKDGVSRWHIAVDGRGIIAGAVVGCGP
ncbi:MAG TPA: hypothetical protein VGM25_08430 [Caulobacteraceae bacterium]|jgi:hypothetical protein